MIGHSLGGSAALMVAPKIKSVKAVCAIAAPSEPRHVLGLLEDNLEAIKEKGEAEVTLAGRSFYLKDDFIHDLQNHTLEKKLKELKGT